MYRDISYFFLFVILNTQIHYTEPNIAQLRMNLILTAFISHIFSITTNIELSLHRMRIDVHLNIHADYILTHKCSDE